MPEPTHQVHQLVDHLFRHEAGRLVATLTRVFGLAHLPLVEDIVQETLLSALHHWSGNAIPDNPTAWLTQVAKRKALNELKHLQTQQRHQETLHPEVPLQNLEEVFLDTEIRDSQLRMIFTCAHPELALESQLALILKTLCGFGIQEIAHALLTHETTINKRLYRARQKFRNQHISFSIPTGSALESRLHTVCLTLYLLFNEGYNSSHPREIIRHDLCSEAMRLTRILTERFPDQASIHALLALMCFHTARFKARLDQEGTIVVLEDQDRALWSQELISKGLHYLKRASIGQTLTQYHLEAGIAAEHCLAKNFDTTNWDSIYQQYELLYQMKQNPIILLNLAIIAERTLGLPQALEKLKAIEQQASLKNYYLLPATQGVFHRKNGNHKLALSYLKKAKSYTQSPKELALLDQHISLCHQPKEK